jgi:insulysin
MVFLGNKKFPDTIEGYDDLIENKMNFNGLTSDEFTLFTFDIHIAGFKNAIEKFAACFDRPSLEEKQIEKEINNFENEYESYKNSIMERMQSIVTSLALSSFSNTFIGSKETIIDNPKKDNINIRDELIKYVEEHYLAHKMKLILYCKKLN